MDYKLINYSIHLLFNLINKMDLRRAWAIYVIIKMNTCGFRRTPTVAIKMQCGHRESDCDPMAISSPMAFIKYLFHFLKFWHIFYSYCYSLLVVFTEGKWEGWPHPKFQMLAIAPSYGQRYLSLSLESSPHLSTICLLHIKKHSVYHLYWFILY